MANFFPEIETGGRLSADDGARLAERVAAVTSAGLPLSPALRAMAEEVAWEHPQARLLRPFRVGREARLCAALGAVADALDAGASVEEAVAAQGSRLPGHLRGLVVIGARTGRMGHVLGRFVTFMNFGTDLNRQLWVSMAYPVFALLLTFFVLAVLCSLMGMFSVIFKDFGVPLPVFTLFLLAISKPFASGWWLITQGLIVIGLLLLAPRLFLSAASRRSLLSGLPVVGAVWRNASLAEFCQLLALLLESEVPLAEALALTGGGVHDAAIDRASRMMAQDVGAGMSLSEAIVRRPVFPRGLARMLRWAEGHQSLVESMRMASEMFQARARSQTGFAAAVLGVLAMLTVLTAVTAVILGMLVPMIQLLYRLAF